jgi:hypothetical protein
MGRRSDIDWEAIRRDFEADLLTGDELAAQHGVDRASIYRKAKKQGWQKNLTAKVQERTAAMLVTADQAGSPTVPGKQQSNRKEPETRAVDPAPRQADTSAPAAPADPVDPVDVAAAANVHVILGHRRTIARAQRLTCRLFDEAEAQFDDASRVLPFLAKADITVEGKPLSAAERVQLATALARAKDLPTRAATVKTLSEALRMQVGLERQAFGIDKDAGGEDPNSQGDFRQRLLNARTRALATRS